MADRKLIKGNYRSDNKDHTETFELEYQEDALKAYTEIIEEYNSEELRRREMVPDYPMGIREVISAEWVGSDIIKYCEFEKVNWITIIKKGSVYDKYKCTLCGKQVKRFGLGDLPISKCKVKK